MAREKRKESFIRRHTLERAWVLARYDAIMRYEHRRGSREGARERGKGGGGKGTRTGEKKRDGENRMSEQEKKKPAEVTERETGGGPEGDGWSCRTDLD